MNRQFSNPSNPEQQKYKFGFFLPNNNLRSLRYLKGKGQRTHSKIPTSNVNLGLAGHSQSYFSSYTHDILPEEIWTNEDLKYQQTLCRVSTAGGTNDECLPPLAGAVPGGKLGGFVSGSVWRNRTPWNCSKGSLQTGHTEKCHCLKNIHLPSVNGTKQDIFNHTEASGRNKNYSSEIGRLPRIKNDKKEYLNSRVSDVYLHLPLLLQNDQSNSVDNLKFRPENFLPAVEMQSPIKLNSPSLFSFHPIHQQGQASKCLSHLRVLPPIKKYHSQRGKHINETLNIIDEETETDILNDNAALANHDREGKPSGQFPNHVPFKDHCVTFEHHYKYVQPLILIPTELKETHNTHVHSEHHDHSTKTLSGDKMYRLSSEPWAKPNEKALICSHYKNSIQGVQNKLEAMKKAKLVENWINILEDIELTLTAGMHITGYFGNHSNAASENANLHGKSGEPNSQSSQSLGLFKGSTNIDGMNFFDKPKSVLQNFGHIRPLNCHTSHVKALQRSNQSVIFEEMPPSVASRVGLKKSFSVNGGSLTLNNAHQMSSLLAINGVNQDLIHRKNNVGGATYERDVGQRKECKKITPINIHALDRTPAHDELTNQKGKSSVKFIHPDTISPCASKATPTMEPTQANCYPSSQDISVRQQSGKAKQSAMPPYASKVLNGHCVAPGRSSKNGVMIHHVSDHQADNHSTSAIVFQKESIVETNADESTSQCRSLPTQACMEGRYQTDPASTDRTNNATTSLKTVVMPEETSKDEKKEYGRLSEYTSHRLEAHSDSTRIDHGKGDNPALDTNPARIIEHLKGDSPIIDTSCPSNVDYDQGDSPVSETIDADNRVFDTIYTDDSILSPRNDTAHFEDSVHPCLRKSQKCVVGKCLQRSSPAVHNTARRDTIHIKFPEEIQPKLTTKSRNQVKVQFTGIPASNRELLQFAPPSLPKYLLPSTLESNFSHPSCAVEKPSVLISAELNLSFPDRSQCIINPSRADAFSSIERDGQNQMEGGKQEEQNKEIDHLIITDSDLCNLKYKENHQYIGKTLSTDIASNSDNLANGTEMGTQDNALEKTTYEGRTPAREQDNTSVKLVPEMKSEKTPESDSWLNRVGSKFNPNVSAPAKKGDSESIAEFLPKTLHAGKIGIMRGELSQENHGRKKELKKPAKFLYPKKVTSTHKSKEYSICLLEGGTTTYSRIAVATEQPKLRNTHGTRNRKHLRLGTKGKSEKEANASIVSGDTERLSPEKQRKRENIEQLVRHWMSYRKLPTGQKLHLRKQTLDDNIKKVLASQCPHIPENMMEDSKLLASLLPSFIDMSSIGGDEISQLSDEIITAALDNCDVDMLLSDPEITMVPTVPPSVVDIMNMVSNNLASSGSLKATDILEVMNILEKNKSSEKLENNEIEKMVYDGLKKYLHRLETKEGMSDTACDGSSLLKKKCERINLKYQRQRRLEGERECETGRKDEDQEMNPEHKMKRRERRQREEEDVENGDGEGNARNKRRGKRKRNEHAEGEEGDYKDESRKKMKRRHEQRERKRKEGSAAWKTSVEDESQRAEWRERIRKRRKKNSSSREELYSEDDNEWEEKREKRRRMKAKLKLRSKDASRVGRGSDGSFSSSYNSYPSGSYYDSSSMSLSDYDSSIDSSNYNSSLSYSYISSTYSPSSCSRYDSEHSITSKSYHRMRNKKELRKKMRVKAVNKVGGIIGNEGQNGHSSVGINGRSQKQNFSTQHGSDEQQMTFSGNRRKISKKERRRGQRHRRRRRSGVGGSGEDNRSSLMDEIGNVMEMVKSIKDTSGDISRRKSNLISGLHSTTKALSKENMLRESSFPNQFLDEDRQSVGGKMGGNQSMDSVECLDMEREGQHMGDEKKQKFEDDMAEIYEREVIKQVANRREMQAMAKNEEQKLKRALSSLARAQEKKKDDAIGRTKRHHKAAMKKFRKQEELRSEIDSSEKKAFQLYANEVIHEYNQTKYVWADMDYAYIALYLGQDYTQELKRMEVAKELEAEILCRSKTRDLEEQRNELLQMLRSTKLDFLGGSEVELSEIAELLRVSRAFVFSYFDNIFGPNKDQECS